MNKNRIIGNLGENIACEYLIFNKWRILRRNYIRKSDEVDIIAISPDGTLVFVEVKALSVGHINDANIQKISPEDNLTAAKYKKLSRICEFFARQNPLLVNDDKGWRIDLLAIDLGMSGKPSAIRHYENI